MQDMVCRMLYGALQEGLTLDLFFYVLFLFCFISVATVKERRQEALKYYYYIMRSSFEVELLLYGRITSALGRKFCIYRRI